MREPEMVEIALRIPPEALRRALQAAAEAPAGGSRQPAAEEENGAFREDVFRRLSREPEERRGRAETPSPVGSGPERPAAESGPEEGGAADSPPRRRRAASEDRGMPESRVEPEDWPEEEGRAAAENRGAAEGRRMMEGRRETAERDGAGAPGSPDPVLPEPPRREERLAGEAEVPVRRGVGAALGRLSAPGPASYAAAGRPDPGTAAAVPEGDGGADGSREVPLTPEALSERWERDSRRYDGGFTLY